MSGKQPKLSGTIWAKSPRTRAQIVRRVCEALETAYGVPRLGNPDDPIDDLVFIILSNKTTPSIAGKTFEKLKQSFESWDEVAESPPDKLYKILLPAGLATIKSQQIKAALVNVKRDFGTCSLQDLRDRTLHDALSYMTSLPGVSDKVARCVMMYTLGFEVLPVDVHVHRVSRRLGWTNRKRADQTHEELEALVPPSRRYAFHVDCIVHGRTTCTPTDPNCEQCPVKRYCEFYKEVRNNKMAHMQC